MQLQHDKSSFSSIYKTLRWTKFPLAEPLTKNVDLLASGSPKLRV